MLLYQFNRVSERMNMAGEAATTCKVIISVVGDWSLLGGSLVCSTHGHALHCKNCLYLRSPFYEKLYEPIAHHLQKYWGYFDHSQSGSGSTPGTTYFGSPGVLPEWLYHSCGSILPVSFFKPCGSTPSRTIPLLREHSHKSGIVGPGALPEWLFCYSGSKIFMI